MSDLDTAFHLATHTTPSHLTTRARVTLWALEQQATHGDATTAEAALPQEGSWVGRKVLLREWQSRRGMTRDEAKEAYIHLVLSLTKRHPSGTPALQTLARLRDALATRRRTDDAVPLLGSPESHSASTTQSVSDGSGTNDSPSVAGSISGSESESDAESASFLSSRESIASADIVPHLKDAPLMAGEDGIRVGDDAFTYSRRGSPPPMEEVSVAVPEAGITLPRLGERTAALASLSPEIGATPSAERARHPAIDGPRRILHTSYTPHLASHLYTPTPPDASAFVPQRTLGTPLQTLDRTPAPPALSESIHAIHVSLTALHERLSVLEHLHAQALRPPSSNPWTSLLRAMGLLSPLVERKPRGWVLPLLFRLLNTVRRAVVDVSFVLVCVCVFTAARAALRRRLRFGALAEEGGRKAVVDFAMGVKDAAERIWRR